jgi:hypothetical protein
MAIILLLVKLLLVSRREMVPEPNDAVEYVSISLDHLGSVFSSTAGYPPGAPLVMALARFPLSSLFKTFFGVSRILVS